MTKLLLIEDDPSLCTMFVEVLVHMNIEVDCAKTLIEAKELLTKKTYDVICLDLYMDGELSIKYFESMKSKVILISGWPVAKETAARHGMEVLLKPFDLHEFEKKVLTIIRNNNSKQNS